MQPTADQPTQHVVTERAHVVTERAQDVVRYGIIGAGMMGVEHIENINALPGTRVTAIADPHEPSQRQAVTAAQNGRTSNAGAAPVAVFDDHASLLASGTCDAIVVATPNFDHLATLTDVLATDLPVLVEKPLCTTVEDCRTVVALTEQREAPVWVGLEYRYMPPVIKLLDAINAGGVGQVHMVAIREHRFPFLTKVDDWNRFSVNTGGTLVEKCCHFFDLMNLIIGCQPTQVMASGAQSVNHLDEVYDGKPSDILDNAFVIVDYENGARAMLDLCMFAEATHNQEEISVVGDRGKVEALIPEDVLRQGQRGTHGIGSVESWSVDPDEAVTEVTGGAIGHAGLHHGSSFVEHHKFLELIRKGGVPEVTVHDGLLSVAVGAAAHQSILENRPVPVET